MALKLVFSGGPWDGALDPQYDGWLRQVGTPPPALALRSPGTDDVAYYVVDTEGTIAADPGIVQYRVVSPDEFEAFKDRADLVEIPLEHDL